MMMTFLAVAALTALASPEFAAGPPETVADGFLFSEGPVWLPDGTLLFSDIPADRIYTGEKEVFREPSGQSNGLTLDLEGRLIAAEHKNRRVSRTEKDGTVVAIAERFEGKRFNSPNDVIVRSDGLIIFTDPDYGLEGGFDGPNGELGYCGVYSLNAAGELKLLSKDFDRPNGLALSPDEKTLFVADSGADILKRFPVNEDGSLGEGEKIFETPVPDGIKVDVTGNVWVTSTPGVVIITPAGVHLGTLAFEHPPANCCFGGADGKTLYVTARDQVYKLPVTVAGIHAAHRN